MQDVLPNYIGVGDFVYRNKNFVPLMVQGEGCVLKDSQGHTYLDAEAANGTLGLGYRVDILEEALKKIKHLPSLPSFLESELRLKVASRLAKIFEQATQNKGRICFELGGAQGIELAVKIALKNTKSTLFAVLEGGYHGRSLFTSHLSASHRYRIFPEGPRVLRLPYPDFEMRLSRKEADFTQAVSSCIDFTLNNDIAGYKEANFAALIIEPILNVGGMVIPQKKYLNYLVDAFRKRGALIIVDEIFTGFYRTGKQWGFQHFDFVPDIVVSSKAFSNGLVPVSCVWARDPYLSPENFPPSTHSITYSNNPLNLAIVDTVLDFYEKEKIDQKVKKIEEQLTIYLNAALSDCRFIQQLTVLGGIGRIKLTQPIADKIKNKALQLSMDRPLKGFNGLIVASTGMAPNVICLHPPFTITEKELQVMVELLKQAFDLVEKDEK